MFRASYENYYVEPTLGALNVFFTFCQFSDMFRQNTRAVIRESL